MAPRLNYILALLAAKHRGQSCKSSPKPRRIESLEARQMMSGSPWQQSAVPVAKPSTTAAAVAPAAAINSVPQFPAPVEPRYEFVASTLQGTEGQRYIEITVRRAGLTAPQDDIVYWTTRNYDAIAGQDYEGSQGMLKFLGNDNEETFRIYLYDDRIYEATEHFKVFLLKNSDLYGNQLRDPSGYLSRTMVKIVDNDPKPFGRWEGTVFVVDAEQAANQLKVTENYGYFATYNGRTQDINYNPQGQRITAIKFNGGAGNDVFVNESKLSSTAFGNGGNDSLTGGSSNDFLYGGAGNDVLQGRGGNDMLYGEAGNDYIYGGVGKDQAFGGDGDDWIYGGAGDDMLYGDSGVDRIYGDAGNDKLWGGLGNDFLYGNEDNDVLRGGDGNDVLRGGKGNDQLFGELGDDDLDGQSGIDLLEDLLGRNRFVKRPGDTIRKSALSALVQAPDGD